jgi:hypothetical protein
MNRALVVGALALSLGALAPGAPALATTDPVSGSGLLAAPTSLSPNDGQVRKTVTLNWAPVSGATGYKVEVGRDATWSDDPVYSATAKVSQLVLPVSLPHGSYVWRVAAMKGSILGHWTSETTDPEFTRGWPQSPTTIGPSGAVVGLYPELSWTPIPFASAYEVQVTDKPFIQGPGIQETAPGTVDTCFTARTRVTFFTEHVQNGEANPGPCFSTILGDGGQRYWRVRGLDRFTGSDASYSTDPAAHGIADVPWSGTPDPSVGSDCQGDTGGGCEPAAASEFSSWSPAVSFSVALTTPGGVYNALSAVTVHALTTDPDNLCDANTPTAGVTTCTDFPTISWDPAPGASRYRVTVALDAAMSNVQRIVDLAGAQWTPSDSWPEGGPKNGFFVTVQACDNNGCGFAGTPVSFRKASPRSVVTSGPPPINGEFTFAWQSYADALAAASGQDETQDAYAYHVQVARSDHPSYDLRVDDRLVDETSYMPQVSYGDGAFIWRVQAVDSAGHMLPWSTSHAFTRDATPPRAVSVSPNTAVGVTQALKVTFSEPVTGVSAASLGFSPSASRTVSVTSPTTATITPTSPLVPGATYRIVVTSAVHDLSGNVADPLGPTFTVSSQVEDTSKAFTYGGSWRTLSSSNATAGVYHSSIPTTSSQTTATMKFAGVGFNLDSCMGPSNGYLDVYVDGVKKARVNLYRSFTGCGVRVATITGLARATHTLKLVGIGAHSSSSKGNAVAVDHVAIYV